MEVDVPNLENYFSLEERPKVELRVKEEKPPLIKLLDNKRSDNIGKGEGGGRRGGEGEGVGERGRGRGEESGEASLD
jgi:hypothetical protein